MATKRKRHREKQTGSRAASPAVDAKRFRGVLTRINQDGLRELRLLAIDRDTRLQTLMIEAINDLLKKYGRRPVAANPLTDR